MTTTRAPKARRWVRPVQVTVSTTLAVVLIAFVMPRLLKTTWGEIWQRMSSIDGWSFAGLMAIMLLSFAMHTFAIVGAMPGIRYRDAFRTDFASTAVSNVVPFGGAIALGMTYAMIRSFGFRRSTIGLGVGLLAVVDTLGKLVLPILGLLALLGTDLEISPTIRNAAIIGTVLGLMVLVTVGVAVSRPAALRALVEPLDAVLTKVRVSRAGRSRDREAPEAPARTGDTPPTGPANEPDQHTRGLSLVERAEHFRARAIVVIRDGWLKMFGGIFGLRLIQAVLFWGCLEAVGLRIDPLAGFAVFTLGRLLALIPITPAGIGVTETGSAAALVSFGADPALAAAGVVLYSLITTVLQSPFGLVSYFVWIGSRGRTDPYGERIEAARVVAPRGRAGAKPNGHDAAVRLRKETER